MSDLKHGRVFARACCALAFLVFPAAWIVAVQVLTQHIQPHANWPVAGLWLLGLIAGLAAAFPFYGLGIFLRAVIEMTETEHKKNRRVTPPDELDPEDKQALASEFFPHLRSPDDKEPL